MIFNADAHQCELEIGDQFQRGTELLILKHPKDGGGFLAQGQGGAGRGIPCNRISYDEAETAPNGDVYINIPMIGYPKLNWKFLGNQRDRNVMTLTKRVRS